MGGIIGTSLLAVEQGIQAGVINVGAASFISTSRLAVANRKLLDFQITLTKPLLANLPVNFDLACARQGENNRCETIFDENSPFRNEPVRINDVPGAIALQDYLDKLEWLHQNSSPESFAPYIRKRPLNDGEPKNVIFQLGLGDRQIDNVSSAAVLRSGDLADYATLYRHDLVYADPKYNPTGISINKNSHTFLLKITAPLAEIKFQSMQQITTFFSSNGHTIIDPDGHSGLLFELLDVTTLPQDCSFIGLSINFKPCH